AARTAPRQPGHRPRDRRGLDRPGAGDPELDGRPDSLLAGGLEGGGAGGDIPRGDPVGLEDDDVVVRLAAAYLAGDDLVQLVHLEPVERADLDGLDQVGRLLP